MKRFTTCLILVTCLAGCKNTMPTPSFNLLAPYGSSRVAPPSTNSVGANNSYYNKTATPTVTVPTIRKDPNASRASTGSADSTATLASGSWKRMGDPLPSDTSPVGTGVAGTGGSQVSQASFNSPTKADPADDPSSTSALLQLTGMPLNDASNLPEPPRFQPAAGAMPLANSNSRTVAPNVGVSTAQASDNIVSRGQDSSSPSTTSTLTWKDRFKQP